MFLSQFTPTDDAKKIITDFLENSEVEEISLENAYQRVIAQEVVSTLNSPPFDRSAMDGYAILAEDSFDHSETNPFHLNVIARIGAGQKSNLKLISGEAIKIATGAPIPAGANAVVMEEYTHEEGDNLEVLTSVTPGENVSPARRFYIRRSFYRKLLGPAELAINASSSFDQVKVLKNPELPILIT